MPVCGASSKMQHDLSDTLCSHGHLLSAFACVVSPLAQHFPLTRPAERPISLGRPFQGQGCLSLWLVAQETPGANLSLEQHKCRKDANTDAGEIRHSGGTSSS